LRKPFDLTTLRAELAAICERHKASGAGGGRLQSAASSQT